MILSLHSGTYMQKYRNQEHEQVFVHRVRGAMVHDNQKAEVTRVSVSGWWTLTVWFLRRAEYYSVLKRKEAPTLCNLDAP